MLYLVKLACSKLPQFESMLRPLNKCAQLWYCEISNQKFKATGNGFKEVMLTKVNIVTQQRSIHQDIILTDHTGTLSSAARELPAWIHSNEVKQPR
jgi:hypothetical protein